MFHWAEYLGSQAMSAIVPFLKSDEAVFGPQDVRAMSIALDDICKTLKLDRQATAKEIVAIRIIELARRGERSPAKLRDRVLHEASSGNGL
jgi:hypothetical protein